MPDDLKWLEIFRAGERTSSNGVTRNYRTSDLDQIVQTYNPGNFKAPLIVSYPAHNTGNYSDSELHKSQLAFGYPEKLKRVGDKLFGGFQKISSKVGEWIRNGEILGFSSSFYPPESLHNPYPGQWALRHVAACGVDPPAVKGMDVPDDFSYSLDEFENYSEDEDDAFEFALFADDATIEDAKLGVRVWNALRNVASFTGETSFMAIGSNSTLAGIFKDFYQRARDNCIADKGVDAAEKEYPIYVLDQLASVSAQPPTAYVTWDDWQMLNSRIVALEQDEEEDDEQEGEMDNSLPQVSSYTDEEDEMPQDEWEQQFSELRDELNQSKSESSLLRQEVERLIAENRAIAQQRETDRITAFCEGLIRDRKLLPANKDKEIRFILSLDNIQAADYGEDGELTPREAYMRKLSDAKELWNNNRLPIMPGDAPQSFGELPQGDFDSKSQAQHQKIRAYAAEHNIEYTEAMDCLIKSGALK